jgi:putative membrane protein
MKKSINLMLSAAMILALSSCGNKQKDSTEVAEKQNEAVMDDANSDKMKGDAEFAVKAADGGMYEVQAGQLALTKGSSAQVKELAQMMVTDHTKGNNELKALAQQKNIVLPTVLGESCQKKFDDLFSKNGADFDKAYTQAMVRDHKDDLDEFKKEADKGNDPDVKSWANGKVALLEHHLMMAENAHKAVK